MQPSLSGEVFIKENAISTLEIQNLAKVVSVVLTDTIDVPNMTVFDIVALGRYPHTGWFGTLHSKDLELINDCISKVGLEHLKMREFLQLSDGEKQRTLIAKALVQDTDFILLDRIGRDIKRFFEEIGIVGARRKVEGYSKNLSVKDIHSFRHTFVYLAAVAGIPFPVVQGIVGHVSPEMTKHYMNHATRAAKMEYLSRLPLYLSAQPPAAKKSARELTPERIAHLIERITPENLSRLKVRLLSLLRRPSCAVRVLPEPVSLPPRSLR